MTSDASRALFLEQLQGICNRTGVSRPEAFPRWICQNMLGITDEGKIDEAVSIWGKNDYGVDIFHADDSGDITEQYVCWAQAKFSENLDHVVNREEIESFAGTLGHMRNCPNPANMTFKQKSSEFVRMTKQYPHLRKRMIFAVAGRLNEQVQDLLNNPKWREERLGDDSVELEILDLDNILSRMTVPHTPRLQLRFDGDVITRTDARTGKKSVIGYIPAYDLVRMVKKHREMIFLENPRQTLGKTAPTHKAILNTLENTDMRGKFWKLNNGITAICTDFRDTNDKTFEIDNFKVVNGRQTIYSLENSTHPTDDVFLLMILHQAVNEEERNQISESTNTQNPIKPVDLVTNYPEMIKLMLQCKREFSDFYFERQSKGFKAANKVIQNRVTSRRILDKNSIARIYCAYAINPNEAMMPEKVLFSVTNNGSYYDKIFKDRKIEELIIPHIFMQMLNALHRKWCGELSDDPSEAVLRKKGIISKELVKYYILRFMYESVMDIDDAKRESIKGKMIERFRNIKEDDAMPDEFLSIAESAYDAFMFSFDADRKETWPEELMKKIQSKGHKEDEHDIPAPYDIMHALKQKGDDLLPHLLNMRRHVIKQLGDKIQQNLLALDSQ